MTIDVQLVATYVEKIIFIDLQLEIFPWTMHSTDYHQLNQVASQTQQHEALEVHV